MDDDKPLKINIGFLGGPVLSARVAPVTEFHEGSCG